MDPCFFQGWTCPSDTRFPSGHALSQQGLGSMRIHCVTMFSSVLWEPNVLTIDPCFLEIPLHNSDLLGSMRLCWVTVEPLCPAFSLLHNGLQHSTRPRCKPVGTWFHEFPFHQDDFLHSLRPKHVNRDPLFHAGCNSKNETPVTCWDPKKPKIDCDATESHRTKRPQ